VRVHNLAGSARVLVGCGVLALAACGGGGSGSEPVPPPVAPGVDGAPYQPLAVGDRWFTLADGVRNEVRVTGTESTAFGTGYVVRRSTQEGVTEESVLVLSGDGLRSVPRSSASSLERAIGPIQLLRFPLRVGTSHTAVDAIIANQIDLDADGRFDTATIRMDVTVVGFETLTIAAGTFNDVLRVRSLITQSATLSSNGQRVTSTSQSEDWYGRGIGLLRSAFTADPGTPGATLTVEVMQAWRIGTSTSDAVAPTVVLRTPLPDSLGRSASVGVTFSEAMARGSVGAAGLSVQRADGTAIEGRTEWTDDRSLRFVPTTASLGSGQYRVSLTQVPEDELGNPVSAEAGWRFSLDSTGPTLLAATPTGGAVDVAPDTRVTLSFDEPLAAVSASAGGVTLIQGNTTVPARVVVEGALLTLIPESPLGRGLSYTAVIGTQVTDTLGNPVEATSVTFSIDPGRFARPRTLGTGIVRGMVLADINGDGIDDLLRTTESVEGAASRIVTLDVRLRAADGVLQDNWQVLFDSFSPFCFPSLDPFSFGIDDLDGDGRRDIAFTSSCGGGLLRQVGSGLWQRNSLLPPLPIAVQVLRLSGASAPGVAFYGGLSISPGLRLLRSIASGNQEVILAGPAIEGGLLAGDFNGDGLTDLVTSVTDTPGVPLAAYRLLLALQRAGGGFDITEQSLPGPIGLRLLADTNGDGRRDIVALVGFPASLAVLRQRAEGGFEAPRRIDLPHEPRNLQVADVDGDGLADFVYLHDTPTGRRLAWARQSAGGSFVDTRLIELAEPPDLSAATSLVVADLTGDGLVDLLAGNVLLVQRPAPATSLHGPSSRASRLGGGLRVPAPR
jgi:hypothetical protein